MSAGSVIVNVIADDSKYREGMARATRATKAAASSWQRDLQKSSQSFNDLTALAGRVGGALGAAFSINALAGAADKVALLSARVKNATSTLTEYNAAFKAISASALNLGTDLSAGVEIFQRLSFNRKELAATNDEMIEFTETVQNLGVASGASRDALKFGLTQLGQSLSSNVLRAEEFNSILENIPAVGNAIAEEFGISTGKLRQLVITGQVLSQDVFAAILNQSEKATAALAKMPVTLERGFGSLLTGVSLFVGEINSATGATGSLGEAMRDVGTSLAQNTTLARQLADAINDIALGARTIGSFLNLFNLTKSIDERAEDLKRDVKTIGGNLSRGSATSIGARRAEYDAVTAQMNAVLNPSPDRTISQDYAKLAGGTKGADKEAAKTQKELNSLLEKNRELITGLDSATLKYIDTQEELDRLRRAGLITNKEYADSVRRLDDDFQESTQKAQAWGVDLEQLGKRAAENIQDTFADFLFDPLDEGFGGMAKGFSDALRRMVAEAAAANLGRVLLGSSDASGKSNKDGLLSGITGGLGDFFKEAFGGLFADGGFLKPGQWGIAGENGPEPIFGGASGMTVIPNGAGAGNHYFIDARGADQGAVRRIEQALVVLAGPGKVEQRVADAQMRGGL